MIVAVLRKDNVLTEIIFVLYNESEVVESCGLFKVFRLAKMLVWSLDLTRHMKVLSISAVEKFLLYIIKNFINRDILDSFIVASVLNGIFGR